ncbi:MAG: hypothetical protein LBU43_07365 [Candidatus Accumulibacter sp.]|jgi:hypothetical protein|nr:hypothetical protein [Accumulibacter sp.]
MESKTSFQILNRLLTVEEGFVIELETTRVAEQLQEVRNKLLEHIRKVGRSGDLSLIVTTELVIVEGDLSRCANSQSMTNSLKTAINEIAAIERHIAIVDNQDKYRAVDQAYSLPKNRKSGLPLDEARQALASHYARLNNLDKSRLDDNEKKVIDARKSAIVDLSQGKKHGNRW